MNRIKDIGAALAATAIMLTLLTAVAVTYIASLPQPPGGNLMPDSRTVTYNDVAELLELCVQPDGADAEPWPNAGNWCQFVYARKPDGASTKATDPEADTWCPVGRVDTMANPPGDSGAPAYDERTVDTALTLLHDAMGLPAPYRNHQRMMGWNDTPERTPRQVADAFHTAIATARRLAHRPIPA